MIKFKKTMTQSLNNCKSSVSYLTAFQYKLCNYSEYFSCSINMLHSFLNTLQSIFKTQYGPFSTLYGWFSTLYGWFSTLYGWLKTLNGWFKTLNGWLKTLNGTEIKLIKNEHIYIFNKNQLFIH